MTFYITAYFFSVLNPLIGGLTIGNDVYFPVKTIKMKKFMIILVVNLKS